MSQATGWFAAARAAYGLALLCWPGRVTRLAQGAPADGHIRVVARVLGGRHLAQAAATAARPSRGMLALGAGTDLAHAASMLALGVAGRRRYRAALADAAVATAFATAGTALARHQGKRSGSPDVTSRQPGPEDPEMIQRRIRRAREQVLGGRRPGASPAGGTRERHGPS